MRHCKRDTKVQFFCKWWFFWGWLGCKISSAAYSVKDKVIELYYSTLFPFSFSPVPPPLSSHHLHVCAIYSKTPDRNSAKMTMNFFWVCSPSPWKPLVKQFEEPLRLDSLFCGRWRSCQALFKAFTQCLKVQCLSKK